MQYSNTDIEPVIISSDGSDGTNDKRVYHDDSEIGIYNEF